MISDERLAELRKGISLGRWKLAYRSTDHVVTELYADLGDPEGEEVDIAHFEEWREPYSAEMQANANLIAAAPDLLDAIAELKAENAKLRAWAESTRMRHYYCEDSWYSCPKAEEGCADEREGPECNCGADKHNAKLDALLKGV